MTEATTTTKTRPATGVASAGVDPVGLSEVAEILGVTKRTALSYTRRSDLKFPAPQARLAMGPVWDRRDVERWQKKRLPLPKGPAPGRAK